MVHRIFPRNLGRIGQYGAHGSNDEPYSRDDVGYVVSKSCVDGNFVVRISSMVDSVSENHAWKEGATSLARSRTFQRVPKYLNALM